MGIYKITNPKGKIYIGKAINIKDRWNRYLALNCKQQIKLYNSLKKYGYENHIFEIVEECLVEQLDEREIYWINYYSSNLKGLNIKGGGQGGSHSEETKQKIGKANKGRIHSLENRKKLGRKKGSKLTEEQKSKITKSKTGHKCYKDPERSRKISEALKGKKYSKEHNEKISKSLKGKSKPEGFGKNVSKLKSKPVIQYDLNMNPIKEWNSIKEAGNALGVHPNTIGCVLQGKNKTAAKYFWKYKIN